MHDCTVARQSLLRLHQCFRNEAESRKLTVPQKLRALVLMFLAQKVMGQVESYATRKRQRIIAMMMTSATQIMTGFFVGDLPVLDAEIVVLGRIF